MKVGISVENEKNNNWTKYYNERKELLKELRRRVNITYRIRIIAADRLRNKDKYAGTCVNVKDIRYAWKMFSNWLKISSYKHGKHQWLEEHI